MSPEYAKVHTIYIAGPAAFAVALGHCWYALAVTTERCNVPTVRIG